MTALDDAINQLDWIDRYFQKNWMEEDFPTDKLYEVLIAFKKEQLAKEQAGG